MRVPGCPGCPVSAPLDSAAGAGAEWGGSTEPGRARLRQRLRQVPASRPARAQPAALAMAAYLGPVGSGGGGGSSGRPAPPAPDAPAPGPLGARAPARCVPLPAPRLGPGAAGVLRGSRSAGPRVGERVRGRSGRGEHSGGPRAPPRPAPRTEPRPFPSSLPHALRARGDAEGRRLRSGGTPAPATSG